MPPKPRLRLPTFQRPRPPLATKPPPHRPTSTSTPTPPATPSTASRPPSLASLLAKTTSLTLLTLSTALLLRDHLLTPSLVTGSSMSPTLSPLYHETGTRDLILSLPYNPSSSNSRLSPPISRNDIITLWKPHRRGELSIKRVIAVEGDVVIPSRGYAEGREVVVEKGHVWVEGDNWRGSWDSTGFGAVSLGLVEGRAGWVWRGGWWRRVQDGRGRGGRSRVVVGGGWREGGEER